MIDGLLDAFVLDEYKKEVFNITNLAIYAYAIFKDDQENQKSEGK